MDKRVSFNEKYFSELLGVYKGDYEKWRAYVKYFSYLVLHHFDLDDRKGRKA